MPNGIVFEFNGQSFLKSHERIDILDRSNQEKDQRFGKDQWKKEIDENQTSNQIMTSLFDRGYV